MYVVPVMHPAFTFRQPLQLGPLQAHVTNFLHRAVHGIPKPPEVYLNPDVRKFRELVERCKREKKGLAVDVEAAPPDYSKPELAKIAKFAKLRAFGVGAAIGRGIGLSWFYPCHPVIWKEFRRAMADRKLTKVFMNGWSYDIPLLRRYGIRVRGPIHDIRDGRRALVSTSKTALVAQASMYLCIGPWKAEAIEDDMKGFVDVVRIKKKRLLTYNAKDCVFTAQIRSHQIAEFNEDQFDKPRRIRLYRQQLRLAKAASWMQYEGFGFDEKRRRELVVELRKVARDRDAELAKLLKPFTKVQFGTVPGQKLNPKAGFRISWNGGVNERDLAALIYKEAARPGIKSFELEVPISERCRTETGGISVDRDALLFLFAASNVPPELKKIIYAAWKADAPRKALSTYVESAMVQAAVGPDQRIHPQHNSCGTETGRWSCSAPNLYNLSESKKDDPILGDLPNVRGLYVAPRGFVIVHRDYKQLELEVMADYTGDVALRQALQTGDAHSYRACKWFNLPPGSTKDTIPKRIRDQTKVVGFQSQYGGAADSVFLSVLEQMPDAVYEEVAAMHAAFPELHVGIKEHWDRSVNFAETHGYNEEPVTNRRRYYPPGMPLKPTETSNLAIQGAAAGIANSAMVGWDESDYKNSMVGRLKREHPKAWLAMHTYDSFDVICPERDAQKVDRLMDETMSGPWQVASTRRPFLSDGKVGKRWSEV